MSGMKVRREESAPAFILKALLGVLLLFATIVLLTGAYLAASWLLGIEKLPPGHPVEPIRRY
jgi:hypothetical protein